MNYTKYYINEFEWDSETRTFIGYSYVLDHFGKKQFIIFNPKTNGFRRFTFLKEENFEGHTEYVFKSEDDIFVRILIDNTFETNKDESLIYEHLSDGHYIGGLTARPSGSIYKF